MFVFYGIGIQLYILAVRIASLFNAKAKLAIDGRRITNRLPNPFPDESFIWFHCASLGEFEQGRPLIEKFRKEHPQQRILLTFYSPSGFEIRKKYDCADVIVYLPFDTVSNVNKFLKKYKIKAAIFIKYDIWPNFFNQILLSQIPLFLTSSVFRKNHWYFKWYGKFVKKLLLNLNGIYVQDEDSLKTLTFHQFTNAIITGDVRVDRVIQIRSHIQPIDKIDQFLNGSKAVVFGSIYASDKEIIIGALKSLPSDVKLIVAPHQVDKDMIDYLKGILPNSVLWSSTHFDESCRVLVIDNVGNLNKVYQYASVAYIGGGFERSIHNILEPAVFNIPVCFGPRHQNFHEAKSLIESKLAFSHSNPLIIYEFICNSLNFKADAEFHLESLNWFKRQAGATHLIYNKLITAI